MESVKLLAKLTRLEGLERQGSRQAFREEIASLIAEIKLEAESKVLPKVSVNIAKAAKKFSEDCYAQEHDKREGIAGANLYHDNRDIDKTIKRQFICDGYIGVAYSKPFDGVIKANGEPIDANNILRHSCKDEQMEIVLPSLAQLKQAVKIETAERGKKNGRSVLRMPSGKAVNIHNMILLMELCGLTGGETAYDVPNVIKPIYMTNTTADGNEIDGIILPIRPINVTTETILLDLMEG